MSEEQFTTTITQEHSVIDVKIPMHMCIAVEELLKDAAPSPLLLREEQRKKWVRNRGLWLEKMRIMKEKAREEAED